MTVLPMVDREPVMLPVLAPVHEAMWAVLCDLADRHPADWVLVGGQMVLLHGLEAGRSPHRVSRDLDAVIDARVRPPVLGRFLAMIAELGFTHTAAGVGEIAHRFVSGDVVLDLLAPEGLGQRAELRTARTASTVEIAGGTQALARAERVPVRVGERTAYVPRPNLAGALVIKAAAAGPVHAKARTMASCAARRPDS